MSLFTTALLGAGAPLVIDTTAPLRRIDGFGASSAWYDDDYMRMPAAGRQALIDVGFDAETGIGLSILRLRIHPQAESEDQQRLIDWSAPIRQATGHFARAVQDAHDPLIMASIWSPPGWMKDNGQVKGNGRLLPEHYASYARFLSAWLRGMEREFGVAIDAFAIQNEPGRHKWETCEWSPQEMCSFVGEHLIPTFIADGLIPADPTADGGIQLITHEEEHWREGHLSKVIADPRIGPHIDIVAAHIYSDRGFPNRPFVQAEAAGKRIWQTEIYHKGTFDTTNDSIGYGLLVARMAHNMLINNRVNAHNFWWLASPQSKDIQSLIELTQDNATVRLMKQGAAFAHFARFVRPGFRIVALSDPFPGLVVDENIDSMALGQAQLAVAAFISPSDDAVIVVAINDGDDAQELTWRLTGGAWMAAGSWRTDAEADLSEQLAPPVTDGEVVVTLPADSITTFRYHVP